ncbi:nuclear transport factor 2 family protein [Cellulomonas sp. URHD0024]|uniref:nuclear transport factor 2 family protein n=1 Tax=Cellulomonas sp. URHD0024 TaxID=1302620 RepID=UPI0003F732FA|nr:nuclear transport factor 2 family protein [Cellulomonas sp. URHD0024]
MTRQAALDLATKWTAMWNGDLALVDEILAPDFRIEFGAVVADPDPTLITTPADMAAFVRTWRSRRGDLDFALQGTPLVDEDGGVAFTWSVDLPGMQRRSGIDLCQLSDGKIARVWSVTGEHAFDV